MKLGPIVLTTKKSMKKKYYELAQWASDFLESPEYNMVLEKLASVPEPNRDNELIKIIGDLALIHTLGYSVPEYLGNLVVAEDGSVKYKRGTTYPVLEDLMTSFSLKNRFDDSLEPLVYTFKDYLSILKGAALGRYLKITEPRDPYSYFLKGMEGSINF